MRWSDGVQVLDLDASDRLEMMCLRCGHLHYVEVGTLQADRQSRRLYLSEVQGRERCKARGCDGRVRMAVPRQHKTSGFVGGIA